MNEEVEIKRVGLGDIDDIALLLKAYRQFYQRGTEVEKLQRFVAERLAHAEGVIFIAYLAGKPIGLVQLYINFTTLGLGKVWLLNDLYVDEKYRGQGVGRQLIDEAVAFARVDGAVRVDIKTEHENLPAKTMYEKYGFQPDEAFVHFHYPLEA